jgi:hypothetical protein
MMHKQNRLARVRLVDPLDAARDGTVARNGCRVEVRALHLKGDFAAPQGQTVRKTGYRFTRE